MSDRSGRDSDFFSKAKTDDKIVSEIRNSFLAAKDIIPIKKQNKPKPELLSHRESFDSNYRPS